MASSKVMASTSPPNPDLPRQSASSSRHSSSSSSLTPVANPSVALLPQHPQHHPQLSDHPSTSFGSMNMEDILKNMYSEPDSLASAVDGGVSAIDAAGVAKNVGIVASKSVDEVWKDIVNGAGEGGGSAERMTLEDFLTKAGAVSEEDLRVPGVPTPAPQPAAAAGGGYGVEAMMNVATVPGVQFPAAPGPVVHVPNGPGGFGLESPLGFGNGMPTAGTAATGGIGGGGSGAGNGRGKRRGAPAEEVAFDKATQQKQRRMIKNRESAARSRERKQVFFFPCSPFFLK